MRKEIALIAGPRGWGDTKLSWLARVPREVKKALGTEKETVSYRTVKSLWFGEIDKSGSSRGARYPKGGGNSEGAQRRASFGGKVQNTSWGNECDKSGYIRRGNCSP